jgi:hypothetical protein
VQLTAAPHKCSSCCKSIAAHSSSPWISRLTAAIRVYCGSQQLPKQSHLAAAILPGGQIGPETDAGNNRRGRGRSKGQHAHHVRSRPDNVCVEIRGGCWPAEMLRLRPADKQLELCRCQHRHTLQQRTGRLPEQRDKRICRRPALLSVTWPNTQLICSAAAVLHYLLGTRLCRCCVGGIACTAAAAAAICARLAGASCSAGKPSYACAPRGKF